MPTVSLQQGESRKLLIDVLSETDQTAVDITDATKIHVHLQVNGTTVSKYSDITETGYGVCEKDGVVTNRINVIVESSESETFPVGALAAVVIITMSDADFIEGKVEQYKVAVGTIKAGLIED